MNELPPSKSFGRKQAYFSLVLQPIEYVTKSLRMGDGWDLTELEPFVRRCRALVDAFDARMEAAKND